MTISRPPRLLFIFLLYGILNPFHLLSQNAGTDATICGGSGTTLNASGGTGYSWSPVTGLSNANISNPVATPIATTTYIVTISTISGPVTDTVVVDVVLSVNASVTSNTTICAGSIATLSASGGLNYSWTTGETTSVITVSPNSTANYSVFVSIGNCKDTATVNVNISPTINLISLSSSAVACGTSTGSAIVNATGGSGALTYYWNPTGQTTPQATGLDAATTVTVTITDAAGCALTKTVSITGLGAPNASITGNTILCIGDTSTLTASGGTSYSWGNGATTTSIQVSPSTTTTYMVVANIGYCTTTAFYTVSVFPPPVASITGNTTICNGMSANLNAYGTGNYLWNTGATTSYLNVSPTSNTSYSITISIGGCSDTASVLVNVVPTPTVSLTASSTVLCAGTGDVATLTATGGSTYLWSNGSSVSSISISPASTTTYVVTLSNGYCSDSASVVIYVLPPPNASISGDTILCVGTTATLTASPTIAAYVWSTGETTAGINTSVPGTYSVVVSIGSCSDTAITNIISVPNPVASAFSDVTIIPGQNADLSATGGTNYLWNNGMTGANINVSPLVTTVYCVTVVDLNNCFDTACITVTVAICSDAGALYLPNAFSPNGDGENDELRIYYDAVPCIKNFHLVLYDFWGEKVYETTDPSFKWNGVYNKGFFKETVGAGTEVYLYYMNAEVVDGSKISRKGNISLLK